jgi:hypothetical protein
VKTLVPGFVHYGTGGLVVAGEIGNRVEIGRGGSDASNEWLVYRRKKRWYMNSGDIYAGSKAISLSS